MQEAAREKAIGPPVAVLRQAADRAVAHTSLRSVAEQVGLTHRGLSRFLGGSDPRSATVLKLRAWYVRRAARAGAVTADTAAAALAVLVDGFASPERDRVAADIVGVLRFAYTASGGAAPPWIRELLD
jgi:hypothetical protein